MKIEDKKPLKFNKIQKSVLLIAFIGLIGILIYMKIKPDLQIIVNKKDVIVTEAIENDGEKVIEIKDNEKIDVIELYPETMTDEEVQNAIHQMSHQKVKADKKWGMIPLTKERVVRLIDVVEGNKDNFKHESTYLKILNRWKVDDFSRVDEDHNIIWTLQNGTVGRATGILTYEEELRFISKYFNVN